MVNFFKKIFKNKKPNIIMIMLDGIRYDIIDKVPLYGQLKKDSTFFPNLITHGPYTLAAMHSLFSGLYGRENGVDAYYNALRFDKKNCFTLAQYLKEQGYYTETDSPEEGVFPSQGFDKYRRHDEYKINFLKRHTEILRQIKNKKPFFLFIRYGAIHINLVNEFIKPYSDFDEKFFNNTEKNFEKYLEWVKTSGDYLRKILEKIKEFGMYDNSIVIVFSDHGCSVGDRPGEKAYGVYLYEYTLRCFLYVMGKGFPKGVQIDSLIRNIDIMPTLLDILKIKEKKGYKKIQGKSFLPFVDGKTEERIAYSETGGLGGPTPSPEEPNVYSIRTGKWKLIYNKTNKKKELYDLENDPEENNNLSGKKKDIENKLWDEMKKYR